MSVYNAMSETDQAEAVKFVSSVTSELWFHRSHTDACMIEYLTNFGEEAVEACEFCKRSDVQAQRRRLMAVPRDIDSDL